MPWDWMVDLALSWRTLRRDMFFSLGLDGGPFLDVKDVKELSVFLEVTAILLMFHLVNFHLKGP